MVMEVVPSLEELVESGKNLFTSHFGHAPSVASCAPGRVNIIGEHVDYNNGYVLPMAMPLWTVIVGSYSQTKSNKCRVRTDLASAQCKSYEFEVPTVESGSSVNIHPTEEKSTKWANYILGTVNEFVKVHSLQSGFDCCVVSSVPAGGGLSSSASLEAAMFTLLEALTGLTTVDKVEKALACQKAEHDFANVPCGIMDQFASILCQENHLLMLDCKTREVTHLQFAFPESAFLVINSRVKHELGDGAYRKRRAMCEHVAATLGVESLREISLDILKTNQPQFDQDHFNKALHVVNEIDRTAQVVKILSANESSEESLNSIGQLMNQSHASLRDLYEVSCNEVDSLVEMAQSCAGVYGARITGGGFGGCCVVLVTKASISSLLETLQKMYSEKYDLEPIFYMATPQSGASIVQL